MRPLSTSLCIYRKIKLINLFVYGSILFWSHESGRGQIVVVKALMASGYDQIQNLKWLLILVFGDMTPLSAITYSSFKRQGCFKKYQLALLCEKKIRLLDDVCFRLLFMRVIKGYNNRQRRIHTCWSF